MKSFYSGVASSLLGQQFVQAVAQCLDRVFAHAEAVNAKEPVAIPFQYFLAVDIFLGVIIRVISRVDTRQVHKVLMKTVVLQNEFPLAASFLDNQKKIDPVHWVVVSHVKLLQILSKLKLGNDFDIFLVL